MGKSIDTLVPDILELLKSGEAKLDAAAVATMLSKRTSEVSPPPSLRMSNFATPDKQLWFAVNKPELGEQLSGEVRLKFLYGDIIEELILDLAEKAGHYVEGRQDELEYRGIKGHRDAIIDGVLIDVKSANSRSFQKFLYHKLEEDDLFGYLDQLSLYLQASENCPHLQVKGEGAFLAVDKELGKICLDRYKKKDINYAYEIGRKLRMLSQATPPEHCCTPVRHGTSGNLRLGVRCSYNPFKFVCHPGLRVFSYSTGPVFLTKVERVPDVEEITHRYSALIA